MDDLPADCKECRDVAICRGGCWVMRINGSRFCYLDTAEKLRIKYCKDMKEEACIGK